MRTILSLFFVTMALPVLAAGWSTQAAPSIGAQVEIPPGFSEAGSAENGARLTFKPGSGAAVLTLWGMQMPKGGFEEAARMAMTRLAKGQWTVDPGGSAYYGNWYIVDASRPGGHLYEKAIVTCDGNAVAAISMEYPDAEKPAIWPLLDRLGTSITAKGSC
ncbi:MAG TPA: hypothetical protein VIL84_07165 [Devosiaceae bacterium]